MKKNILFVLDSLECNGASKSAISLLNEFDYDIYSVDLLILNEHDGFFKKQLNSVVNILETPVDLKNYFTPLPKVMKQYLFEKKLDILYERIRRAITYSVFKKRDITSLQKHWKNTIRSFEDIDKTYDVAIGFNEIYSTYYIAEKVVANVKIGWNHNDYEKMKRNKVIDNEIFINLDYIVSVCDENTFQLKQAFSYIKSKFITIENINSPTLISYLANSSEEIEFEDNYINILTIGRLVPQKGIDIAVRVCKSLRKENYNIKWYVIGEGPEEKNIFDLIKKEQLEDTFILLGKKNNPYIYMNKSDIIAQTSRYEGKSIVLDEAKILNKCILCTNYPSVHNQIKNNENGEVVEFDIGNICEGIKKLIDHPNIRLKYMNNLKLTDWDNKEEINKLYEIINIKN